MSWASKAHKKHQVHKLVEQALNSKEYQDARKDDMQQSALRAFCRFCFVACEYLEMKHGYKEKGLHSFLAFAKGRKEMVDLMMLLAKEGIDTDFLYEKDGEHGLWLEVRKVKE